MRRETVRVVGLTGLTLLALVANAVVITLFLAPGLYRLYLQWGWIRLPQGMSLSMVAEEFGRVWTYLWQPWQEPFQLQYFASSAGGRQHFAEVKRLIVGVLALAPLATVGLWWRLRRQGRASWSYGRALYRAQWGMGALVVAVLFFFDRVFVVFHQVLFANDLWLFDPRLDPIIWVLPQSYFLGLALLVFLAYAGQLAWLWRKLFPKT